ncbi:MAG: beta-galactosidase, partial [Clostridia bacterium]|nr:beta-galactosidase [Clostridia bacterium]
FPPPGEEINHDNLDLYSRMYPSVEEIDRYFAEGTIDKPYVLCEYCHAMGNGPGDLEDYFQCFHRHEGHCGGFIWEWCDHAVIRGQENGRPLYGYGGDSGEYPHDGNFCMDGLVYPDRRPHTGLKEYKNVLRPARIVASDVQKGNITLWNTLDFTDLADAVTVDYEVRQAGRVVYRGRVDQALLRIAPHQQKEITLPLPEGLTGDFALHILEYQKENAAFVPAGDLVGEDEAGRQVLPAAESKAGAGDIAVSETARHIVLRGDGFQYTYNKATGCFDRWAVNGRDVLAGPMGLNIWRAPTDNDQFVKSSWRNCGYDHAAGRAYETRVEQTGEGCHLTTAFSIVTPYMPPIVQGRLSWLIQRNGDISLTLEGKRKASLPFLPRFGLRLFVNQGMDQLQYFGYGPYESYVDKHRGTFRHLYDSTVAGEHEDYIRPQENGSHYDCDYLRLSGDGVALTVWGEGFSFNASSYTQEELTEKAHNDELRPAGVTVLCVDGYMSGVGSNSCGPALAKRYQAPEDMMFACRFTLS